MYRRSFLTLSIIAVLQGAVSFAETPELPGLKRVSVTVDGMEREALVYVPIPPTPKRSPLVFVFHGHGGSARQAVLSLAISREWPSAISVYPQGLNTPGRLTDPEGKKSGWQSGIGDQGDRDLKFFDALFEKIKKEYPIDENRVYSTGHSNGGGFTYLLWETRNECFAAFAPSGAMTRHAAALKPKPALHIAGQADPLVKFEWQKLTMDVVRRNNGCDVTGQESGKFCTLYPSKTGTPFMTFIHPGGHEFPADAPAAIVRFFKDQKRP